MATEQSVMAVIRASRPSFRNAHDKIAFAVHSSFLASGYVLNATGPAAFSDNALSSTSTDEVGIDGWNEFGEYYGFVYSKPDKGSKKVLVKCLPMNDKLLVDALSDGDSEPLHLEIDVGDYVGEEESSSCSSQFKNLGKLVSILDKENLSKLNGSSTAVSSIQPSSSGTRESLRDNPNLLGVGVAEPRGSQPYPSGIVSPQVNPVGGMDVIPGPPPGMCPIRGGLGRGGGMLVGPDHPLFHGIGRGQPGVSSGIPPGAHFDPYFDPTPPDVPDFDPVRLDVPSGIPPEAIPPGARFDPYGPPDVPDFDPIRFGRIPRRPPGGTHPDLERYGDDSDFI